MNVLIVYAHPEPRSLNGSLKSFICDHLNSLGHHVMVSDLYAMRWKASLDQNDFPHLRADERFDPSSASQYAFLNDSQPADIKSEQDKLHQADLVIWQFPMWWFSMPAIMKGWFERVYAYGLGYGVGEHNQQHWGDRYGEGSFAGKRAMIVTTMGGWESHYSERGINGALSDLLFPIEHGMLFYAGFSVLPAVAFYRVGRFDAAQFEHCCQLLTERLNHIEQIEPIDFRQQNGGDYVLPALTLHPRLSAAEKGLKIHRKG
ncbi:NAD(P)H-dependent oxidoreductase [Celerinatantimonas yamalensis]|uniref:NAD(P)H-dependent oxidoreductase n=1 Tax=Celerinatantimonas yamalensis TaxID=559956 RepID=A0ABW9G874_9GAMM